jgi:hypothetical protein
MECTVQWAHWCPTIRIHCNKSEFSKLCIDSDVQITYLTFEIRPFQHTHVSSDSCNESWIHHGLLSSIKLKEKFHAPFVFVAVVCWKSNKLHLLRAWNKRGFLHGLFIEPERWRRRVPPNSMLISNQYEKKERLKNIWILWSSPTTTTSNSEF